MFAAIVFGFCALQQEQRDDDAGGEHHRDGERLAERAAEAEHGRRDTMPARPNGSTAIRIISQRVAPSASAASSCRRGVCRKISRDRRGDDRDDHHREHQADGEDRAAGRGDRRRKSGNQGNVVASHE